MAFLRALRTHLRGGVPCGVPWCGRAVRHYGYCARHVDNYSYAFGDIFSREAFSSETPDAGR